MADEQALNDAIAELGTAVDALIAKANEADVDLTDEVAALQGLRDKVQAAAAAPAPGEGPPPEEPV